MTGNDQDHELNGSNPAPDLTSLAASGLQGIEDVAKVFGQFVSMLDPAEPDGPTSMTADQDRRSWWQEPGDGPGFDQAREPSTGARMPRGDIPVGELRSLVARLGDIYLDIVVKLIESSFGAYAAQARSGPRLHGGPDAMVTIRRPPDGPALGELYLHNHESEPSDRLTLVATDLTSSDGSRIAAAHVNLDPVTIERIGPGSTAVAIVSIDAGALVDIDESAVLYGHVLVAGQPEAGVPIRVVADVVGPRRETDR